jgi:hypothetical protein
MNTGVHYHLPDSEYRSVNAASNSLLKKIADAEFPVLAKQQLDHPKETGALIFGRALHCAWGEPERFLKEYVTLPDGAPKKPTAAQIKSLTGKKPNQETVDICAWWDAWNSENYGREILDREDYDIIRRMTESVNSHPEVVEFLKEKTFFEVSAFAEINGYKVKARCDAVNSRMADLKSIDGITTRKIEKAIDERKYYMQHPFYLDVFAVAGLYIDDFRFFFVDKNTPHICRVVRLPQNAIDAGRVAYERALELFNDCQQFDYWPGPPLITEEIGIPYYSMKRIMEIEHG